MKKTVLGMMVCASLLIGSSASALNYTFVDNNPAVVHLDANNTTYNSQFDITAYGYNPATMQVNSASATFTLGDLCGSEGYNIIVDGSAFVSGSSFFGLINVGGSLGSLLGSLSSDGILNYTISRTSGEFWFFDACLTAKASDRSPTFLNSVPDGGLTVSLLGLGLISLGFMKRKLV